MYIRLNSEGELYRRPRAIYGAFPGDYLVFLFPFLPMAVVLYCPLCFTLGYFYMDEIRALELKVLHDDEGDIYLGVMTHDTIPRRSTFAGEMMILDPRTFTFPFLNRWR